MMTANLDQLERKVQRIERRLDKLENASDVEVIRPTALRRLKDTYRDKGIILPAMSTPAIMQQVNAAEPDLTQDYSHPSEMSKSEWCPHADYTASPARPPRRRRRATPASGWRTSSLKSRHPRQVPDLAVGMECARW